MNKICFSLWGNQDLYCKGAVANVHEAAEVYPGWCCRFYVMQGCPAIEQLQQLSCEVIIMPAMEHFKPEFWRFHAASENIDYCLFRDCDSRVNTKEAAAVCEWVASDKIAHIMKDSFEHTKQTIMAGMWGIRGGVIADIHKLITQWTFSHDMTYKYTDQQFLKEIIWPRIRHSVLIHGPGDQPYPLHSPMKYGEYIGQVIYP